MAVAPYLHDGWGRSFVRGCVTATCEDNHNKKKKHMHIYIYIYVYIYV
jgi:hypothetical protein